MRIEEDARNHARERVRILFAQKMVERSALLTLLLVEPPLAERSGA